MLLPEPQWQQTEQNLEGFLERDITSMLDATTELYGVTRDGKVFPMEVSVSRWEVDGEIRYTAFLRNITLRRHLEEERSQLARMVEHASDAIISTRKDGRIVFWNQASEKLYGYKSGEMLGASIALIVPPECFHQQPSGVHSP